MIRSILSILIFAVFTFVFVSGCATTKTSIVPFDPSSDTTKPISVAEGTIGADSVHGTYRMSHRSRNGALTEDQIRREAFDSIESFASERGKSFVVRSQWIAQAPYGFKNPPGANIVFSLVDKEPGYSEVSERILRYRELEKLQTLLEQGTVTRDEFETEKSEIVGSFD